MRTQFLTVVLVVMGLVLVIPGSASAYLDTFDSNIDGWTTAWGTNAHQATGGNPDGYLEATSDSWFLGIVVPPTTGDLVTLAGSNIITISYDFKQFSGSLDSEALRLGVWAVENDQGGEGGTWQHDFVHYYVNYPTTWTNFSVTFDTTWTDAEAEANGWFDPNPGLHTAFADTWNQVLFLRPTLTDTQDYTHQGDSVIGLDNFQIVPGTFAPAFLPGDANGDGVVSAGDYAAVQSNFGAVAGASTVPPVPEPATMSMLAVGAGIFLRRRRRV